MQGYSEFIKRHHDINKAHLLILSPLVVVDVTLHEQSCVEQRLTHGALQKWMAGCHPSLPVEEGDIGIRGVGEQSVLDDNHLIGITPLAANAIRR